MSDPYSIHLDYCPGCREGDPCGVGTILLELKIRTDDFVKEWKRGTISLDTQEG